MALDLEVIVRKARGGFDYPPLLFVHGSCHAAWCWDEHFLPYFAERGFDAHALSLRGHGESAIRGSLRWTSIADYVADVGQVAAMLPREPVVIGHSLGGFVVQKYLERHEAPGAVLVAPAPPVGRGRMLAGMILRDPWLAMKVLGSMEPYTMFATPERCRRFLFSPATDEKVVQDCWARLGRESYLAWLRMLWLPPDASRIRGTPMLLLAGAEDRIIPGDPLRRTAQRYDADIQTLPDVGHDIMLEANWQQAADAMLDWLHQTLTPA